MSMSDSVSAALKGELLCIGDSNWVLGHWYTNCMLNGRELTDFTSMAGIARSKLDLPVWWRWGNLFGMCRFVHRSHGDGDGGQREEEVLRSWVP